MSVEAGAGSPELTPEVKQQLVTRLGSLLHDEWRAPRKVDIKLIEEQIASLAEDERSGAVRDVEGTRVQLRKLTDQKNYLESLDAADTFEPRMKTTKDEAWASAHGTNELDIANTSFENLPSDWQGENRAAAEVAMKELFNQVESGGLLDDAFVEQAATTVHEKWLERNGSWAPPEQNKPFGELSEEEKEKDRVQVRKAIELYEAL